MEKRINADRTICSMSGENFPVAHIKSGDSVIVETLDCFSGRLKTERDLLKNLEWNTINPCTGPIYIEGAIPGDVLMVEILDILPNRTAVTIQDGSDLEKYGISREAKSLYVNISDEGICIDEKHTVPLRLMIGTIGTAPETDSVLTTLPGIHGGNMDNSQIGKGSKVYLPVYHNGALLALGDLHAAMGDGEAVGCGIEVGGRVKLRITTEKDCGIPVPFVETDDLFITVASAPSLEQAAEYAVKNMLLFLTDRDVAFDSAWNIISASGNVAICQFANKLKTVRCELKKTLFNEISVLQDRCVKHR